MLEKCILVTNVSYLKKYHIPPVYKRLYFGNEFCQTLIPIAKTIEGILKYVYKKKLHLTLLTPFVTDNGLQKLTAIFKLLVTHLNHVEVVVNDWGVLQMINEQYRSIQPVLGRLMFRQKRDPRIANLIRGNQKAKIVSDGQGKKTIFLPKELPSSLKEAYTKTNIDFYLIRDFLLQNRIKRVELDNLIQGLSLNLPGGISASMYFPYGYITITRYCHDSTPVLDDKRIGYCRKECSRYFFKLRSPHMPKIIYKKGNTQFYKNNSISRTDLAKQGIDRLIYEPELPV